jgi:DNA uptake protein ComE-like DNA-binding protein
MSIIKVSSKLMAALFIVLLLVGCGSSAPSNSSSTATGAAMTVDGKINLNNMTEEQLLDTIPDFSSRMVREFFEYQPYVSIQQFRREIGKYVDEAQVAAYEQYVFVPVDANEADADTLMQLPGVDDTIAADLIAGRPYVDSDAFLTQLGEYVSADQATTAASYLTSQ